jgi:hypothetical protein
MSEKPTYSEVDLTYAVGPVLPTIQAVYDKYDGRVPIYQPGVEHVGDINRDRDALNHVEPKIRQKLEDPNIKKMLEDVFGKGTLIGGIDVDRGKGIGLISFRGTRGILEWLEDFTPLPVPFKEVPGHPIVHLGFYIVYLSLRQNLLNQLPLLEGLDRVIVSGHSLGAAVATLCLLDLASNHVDRAKYEGVTFASPRIFGGGFGTTGVFEDTVKKNLRVFNRADLVTGMPTLVPYFHVPGGLSIGFVWNDLKPHDLMGAYLPGTMKIVEDHYPDKPVDLNGPEDKVLAEEYERSREALPVEVS